ncbi:MAG TPA: oxalate/formate MFS antiporter [Xanthobacteraceae bacterium]|jgi:OFA family oxalate/formate antiporter-like MFS transporter|nr:oxalate/formate MFS antiporter [Xanthobacteraceae bacterium]
MTVAITTESTASLSNRWSQLVLGVIAMMAISSPQYVWTLFTGPLNQKLGTSLAELQWTISLLVILQTWFSPFQAYLVDRFGPRLLISLGALLSGASWVLSAYVDNLWALYFTYGVLGGFGTGIIYVGIIGLMVRWFPDRRGLATGLAAAGYGFGAFFTSFPIDSMIKSSGYAQTFIVWGVIQAVIGVLAAQWLRTPPDGYQVASAAPAPAVAQSRRSYSPREMLKSPVFYLLFIMMSMMSTSGLMVVFNVGPFAKDFGVANMLVFGMAALPLSLTLSRVTNGLTRPFFGWVSDHIGREATMTLAFSLECAAILVLFAYINQPALFVVLSGLVFFGWGEIFSLFPSTLTDTFGPKYAATNYGFLYIAQGVGSILAGPAAAFLKQQTGSWTAVFIVVAVLDAVTAILAIAVLKPMRAKHLATA